MEYTPAQLDRLVLARLQQFEQELREELSEDIVVVAYEASSDTEQAGNRE
ncbi:hypothetical protein GZH47_13200 [Paenibacillus rhizovicinus]|uniref:Uncharacterized protein n=1 Tax=Paenibacillus rhizovicinus TaxID=2704463 RepID=A0A6C0P001_9BACL|nr:hypothetical protein [Paenibacillus rhizovicinus]QHW31701.1 hypothetical protein GZH47_13200 [Paenibacillus rhizovicinus]